MNKLIIVPVNLSSTKYVNFANLHFILSFQIKGFYLCVGGEFQDLPNKLGDGHVGGSI